jgi:hypothetical protein
LSLSAYDPAASAKKEEVIKTGKCEIVVHAVANVKTIPVSSKFFL